MVLGWKPGLFGFTFLTRTPMTTSRFYSGVSGPTRTHKTHSRGNKERTNTTNRSERRCFGANKLKIIQLRPTIIDTCFFFVYFSLLEVCILLRKHKDFTLKSQSLSKSDFDSTTCFHVFLLVTFSEKSQLASQLANDFEFRIYKTTQEVSGSM